MLSLLVLLLRLKLLTPFSKDTSPSSSSSTTFLAPPLRLDNPDDMMCVFCSRSMYVVLFCVPYFRPSIALLASSGDAKLWCGRYQVARQRAVTSIVSLGIGSSRGMYNGQGYLRHDVNFLSLLSLPPSVSSCPA